MDSILRCSRALVAAAAVMVLVGCSGAGDNDGPGDSSSERMPVAPVGQIAPNRPADVDEGTAEPVAPPEIASESPTVGGDGSEIVLAPLSAADIEAAALADELACSFSAAGDAPLLLAKGDVASDAPARGVVKVGSYVEPVAAPGGFDGMLRGARFTGAGKTITIEVTGPAIGSGESPPNPATLTYDRADGARRQFAGQWQCGP